MDASQDRNNLFESERDQLASENPLLLLSSDDPAERRECLFLTRGDVLVRFALGMLCRVGNACCNVVAVRCGSGIQGLFDPARER